MKLKHLIGNPRLQISGNRAIADTDICIMLRVGIGTEPVIVDVTSWARFVDRYEKRNGQWKILHRTAVYEKDRADPVVPDTSIQWTIGPDIINSFPEEYDVRKRAHLIEAST